MGQINYNPTEWAQSIYWQYDPKDGWESYHADLDKIVEYARSTPEPFMLIFDPTGDVPRNNPLSHMQRLVKVSKQQPMILTTIIVMESNWVVARAFTQILNKLMALQPDVYLTFSMEDARNIHAARLAEITTSG